MRPAVVALIAATGAAVVVFSGVGGASSATKAKCNNSNPVVAGFSYSLSGPTASLGLLYKQGTEMAIRDINAAGGVLGRCLKEDMKDDAASATTAAQVARQLIDQDHASFIVGPFLAGPVGASIVATTQAKIIQIVLGSFQPARDPSKYPYVVAAEQSTNMVAESTAAFVQSRHWTKVALLAVNQPFGTLYNDSVRALAPKYGFTVVGTQFADTGTADVTPQMTSLRSGNPQVLLAGVATDPDQIAIIRARSQLGWNIPVLGLTTMANPVTVSSVSPAQMKDVYAGQVYKAITYRKGHPLPTWAPARQFIAGFAKWLHVHGPIRKAITSSAGAYDGTRMIAWAINGAKSLDPDKVRAWFSTHRYNGARGSYFWSRTVNDGTSVSMLGFALANSLNGYGILQLAPAK